LQTSRSAFVDSSTFNAPIFSFGDSDRPADDSGPFPAGEVSRTAKCCSNYRYRPPCHHGVTPPDRSSTLLSDVDLNFGLPGRYEASGNRRAVPSYRADSNVGGNHRTCRTIQIHVIVITKCRIASAEMLRVPWKVHLIRRWDPTRPLSLRPEALGAVQEATNGLKHSEGKASLGGQRVMRAVM
jgi:hypothetical protein